ncbi:MAG: hypothetical protein KDD06_16685 [Phaeodactylibacter sp.]|nr:hypothetical protein [Phaeodactylibacter sp.]MCB9264334.1 hypothetical protein [Lewinellaceae bacterium]MCB9286078.1 hypothetical protein [Lewinellaceae bacterium]
MLRLLARLISFIFHPLLIVTYMLVLLLLINPYLFGVSSIADKASKLLILQIFLSTFFIPGVAVAMLRFTGMIKSFEMESRQERIGPYIITGVFYLWMFRNFLDNPSIPTAFTSFVLGAAIGLFFAFFINIFSKISAHAVGVGGLLGMVVITMLLFSYDSFTIMSPRGALEISMSTVLLITILVAGLVGTSRLVLKAHEPMDLYGGYLVGFASQFLALRFLF